MDEEGIVTDKDTWWCFIDWADGLNKQAGAQGILIYALRHAIELAKYDQNEEKVKAYEMYLEKAVADGADTFWELYDPADKNTAPYGSKMVNSYCHAWSCSPSYIIRKYLV